MILPVLQRRVKCQSPHAFAEWTYISTGCIIYLQRGLATLVWGGWVSPGFTKRWDHSHYDDSHFPSSCHICLGKTCKKPLLLESHSDTSGAPLTVSSVCSPGSLVVLIIVRQSSGSSSPLPALGQCSWTAKPSETGSLLLVNAANVTSHTKRGTSQCSSCFGPSSCGQGRSPITVLLKMLPSLGVRWGRSWRQTFHKIPWTIFSSSSPPGWFIQIEAKSPQVHTDVLDINVDASGLNQTLLKERAWSTG